MIINNSKTTTLLIEELRKIFDDEEFVTGILIYADSEHNRKKLLEFIRKGVNVTVETVTVLALDLNDLND